MVDAVAGVQVVTEKVWDYCSEYSQPGGFGINWMDRELASFERALESVQEGLGRDVVPLQPPIGAEKQFRGVVDLLSMKALVYTPDGDGRAKTEEIPAELGAEGREAHEKLVEMVAEGDDKVMEEFCEKGTLPLEDLKKGLRLAFRERRLFPVVLSSALHNMGSDAILNLIIDVFPDPAGRGNASGFSEAGGKGNPVERKIADSEQLSIFVFKTLSDPFAGRINYFKVMSGVLKNDATVTSFTRGTSERFQHVQLMQGKTGTEVTELHAGDLPPIAKLKETITGDSLGDKAAPS